MKLNVIPPHINHSQKEFSVNNQGEIIYGLCAIKGVGLAAIDLLISERVKNGNYKNIFDFLKRIDLQKLNKRVIEALICAGALDHFEHHRATILCSLDNLLKRVEQDKIAKSAGQSDLFGFGEPSNHGQNNDTLFTEVQPFSLKDRLKREKSSLGLYLSGHLIDEHKQLLDSLGVQPLNNINSTSYKSNQRFAGVVVSFIQRKTKSGKPFGILSLDDSTTRMDITIFSNLYEKSKDYINVDETLIIEGDIDEDSYTGGLRINAKLILTINQAINHYVKRIAVYLKNDSSIDIEDIIKIKTILNTDKNTDTNQLSFHWQYEQVNIHWPLNYNLNANIEAIESLKKINSISNIKLLLN